MDPLESSINSLTHTEIYEITITQSVPDPILLQIEGQNEAHEIRKVNAINLERLLEILEKNQIEIDITDSSKKIRYPLNKEEIESDVPLCVDFENIKDRIILQYELNGHLIDAKQNRLGINITNRKLGYGIVWKFQYTSYSNLYSTGELAKALYQFKKTIKDFYN